MPDSYAALITVSHSLANLFKLVLALPISDWEDLCLGASALTLHRTLAIVHVQSLNNIARLRMGILYVARRPREFDK